MRCKSQDDPKVLSYPDYVMHVYWLTSSFDSRSMLALRGPLSHPYDPRRQKDEAMSDYSDSNIKKEWNKSVQRKCHYQHCVPCHVRHESYSNSHHNE